MPLVALCLAGCGITQSDSGMVERSSVVDRYWAVRTFQHKVIKKEKPEVATVRFRRDGQIGGTATCNSIGGGFTWYSNHASGRGGVFGHTAQSMIKTVVGCPDQQADALADRFWDRMEGAERWSLQGNKLRIEFKEGDAAELVPVATPPSERRPDCKQHDPRNLDCRDDS